MNFEKVYSVNEGFYIWKKLINPLTLVCILFLSPILGFSQINIEGVVRDTDDETLIGVNVQVRGTNKGTSTDFEGRYKLENVDENAILVFSYVGFETQEVSVDGRTNIDVVLKSDAELLEEIVVVGYGEQKKVNVIGSVTAISGSEVAEIPAPDLTNAISGRLPGSVIMQESGEPGRRSEERRVGKGWRSRGGGGG